MVHSNKFPQIDDEIDDVCLYLIENKNILISDLRKEYLPRYLKGKMIHSGFKLQQFQIHIDKSIKQRIRELYTFDKRWYITSETTLLIEEDSMVSKFVNEIIKEVLDE